MTYITKPKTIKKSDIENKFYSFMSSEYRVVKIKNNNIKLISNLIDFEDVGSQIDVSEYLSFNSGFFLGTVSGMDNILYESSKGERISKNIYELSSKKLKKGDVIISRNASLGKISLFLGDKKTILNGGLSYLRFKQKYKYYTIAYFISNFGKEYLTCITSGGGTQQNAKRENILELKIPFPTEKNNKNPENVEKYLSLIVQNIIDKEEQIKKKDKLIDELIEKELKENQNGGEVKYSFPKISEILEVGRLDTGLYEREFKYWDNLIKNYNKSKIYNLEDDLGFNISRGQNLQISNIGNSYYSNDYKKGFYKLLISKDFTNYGGFKGFFYIGNKKKLKEIRKGDIIFSCRGDLGRLIIFNDNIENTITNIDNVHIRNNNIGIIKNTFIGLWLKFLKNIGYINKIAITGSGADSFTQYQFKELPILLFPEPKQKEIAKLYYNKVEKNSDLNLENYLEKEKDRNKRLGIFQLNMEIFDLREKLENLVEKIVYEKEIKIEF